MGDWYNGSASSPELNIQQQPFGFFHTPLSGYEDG
jgi:hypothetical protein